jgi:prepilin-type N-terminal cleavage/methylation domain-containing protein
MKPFQRISGRLRAGFTLVELLVVIGIIGLLVGLTLPAIQAVRESARRTACQNNLRQLALATFGHEAAHGYLVGPLFRGLPTEPDYRGDAGLFVQLLPYLEQQNLYNQFDSGSSTVSVSNHIAIQSCPGFLQCPASMPSQLTGLAEQFSGPPINELVSKTCDYVGNGGWFSPDVFVANPESLRGAISTHVSHIRPALRLAGIADGTSHTFCDGRTR